MNKKKSRLQTIVDILAGSSICSQDELAEALAARGFSATQATLSRDLKTLRTTKAPVEGGGYRYMLPAASDANDGGVRPRSMTYDSNAVLSLAVSGNMIVIKTRNGYASGLAYEIDQMHSPHVLGTIPGADTVLAVTDERSSRSEVFDFLLTVFPRDIVERARGSLA